MLPSLLQVMHPIPNLLTALLTAPSQNIRALMRLSCSLVVASWWLAWVKCSWLSSRELIHFVNDKWILWTPSVPIIHWLFVSMTHAFFLSIQDSHQEIKEACMWLSTRKDKGVPNQITQAKVQLKNRCSIGSFLTPHIWQMLFGHYHPLYQIFTHGYFVMQGSLQEVLNLGHKRDIP